MFSKCRPVKTRASLLHCPGITYDLPYQTLPKILNFINPLVHFTHVLRMPKNKSKNHIAPFIHPMQILIFTKDKNNPNLLFSAHSTFLLRTPVDYRAQTHLEHHHISYQVIPTITNNKIDLAHHTISGHNNQSNISHNFSTNHLLLYTINAPLEYNKLVPKIVAQRSKKSLMDPKCLSQRMPQRISPSSQD